MTIMLEPTMDAASTSADVGGSLEQYLQEYSIGDVLTAMKQMKPDGFDDRLIRWQKKQKPPEEPRENPFARTGKPASRMEVDPAPPEQLWFGLYRGAVTYLAGETGAGKSSALYNIAVHAALDKPLWGIPFGLGRPLNVWYLDPENARTQAAWKLNRINIGRPPNLIIDSASGIDLCTEWHQQCFERWVRRHEFDLVIIDPLVNLFATADENDNAEAVQQMTFLQSVAQETRAAILLVHHMGKASNNGAASQYGRGASARLASADVGLKWEAKSDRGGHDDTYQPDQGGVSRLDECRLQTTKNRLGKYGSLYLRMVGDDRFDVSTWDAWYDRAEGGERISKAEQGVEAIRELMSGGGWTTRKDLLVLLKELDIGESKADEALKEMCDEEPPELTSRKAEKGRLEYAWADWVADQPTA